MASHECVLANSMRICWRNTIRGRKFSIKLLEFQAAIAERQTVYVYDARSICYANGFSRHFNQHRQTYHGESGERAFRGNTTSQVSFELLKGYIIFKQ